MRRFLGLVALACVGLLGWWAWRRMTAAPDQSSAPRQSTSHALPVSQSPALSPARKADREKPTDASAKTLIQGKPATKAPASKSAVGEPTEAPAKEPAKEPARNPAKKSAKKSAKKATPKKPAKKATPKKPAKKATLKKSSND